MDWRRTTIGRLVCDRGAYRGVVERTHEQTTWTALVEHRGETTSSVFDYPTMLEAQQWVERKLEDLLSRPPAQR